jgi:hypothetical protein
LGLAFVLIMIETRGLSFFADEWDYLLDRRGTSVQVLLTPHGPHLSLFPILVYKVLLAAFGASSYLPFRVLTALNLVVVALLLGVICRRLWGPWWGLVPVVLLVALGTGASTLLSPFQVGITLSLAGGLLTFIGLPRRTNSGDLLACAGLVISLGSSSQGIGFLVGAAVYLVLRGEWRRKIWIVLIPSLLWGLWYLKYGQQASETQLSLWNTAFLFTVEGIAATISGLLALTAAPRDLLDPSLGQPLLYGALGWLAFAWSRGRRPEKLFWAAAIALVVLFVATAVSNTPSIPRFPNASRYLSTDATLLLICVCATVPAPRLRRGGTLVAALLVAIIAATNISQYAAERTSLRSEMAYTRAETGALLVMRGLVAPDFRPSPLDDPGAAGSVRARTFFSAYDSFGTLLSDSTSALSRAPEPVRVEADGVLQRGERIALAPAAAVVPAQIPPEPPSVLLGARVRRGGCLVPQGSLVIRGTPGVYLLAAPRDAVLNLALARFASVNSVPLGQLSDGASVALRIPADHAPNVPWRIAISGRGGRVCQAAA